MINKCMTPSEIVFVQSGGPCFSHEKSKTWFCFLYAVLKTFKELFSELFNVLHEYFVSASVGVMMSLLLLM